MSKENPMICDNNLDVEMIANKLIRSLELDKFDFKEMIEGLEKIVRCSKDAMKQGQRMEKRMKKYHDKILSLGFERVRKEK